MHHQPLSGPPRPLLPQPQHTHTMPSKQGGDTLGGKAVVNQLGQRAVPALQLGNIHHGIAGLDISNCQIGLLQL